MEGWPVDGFALVTVRGGGLASQLEGLADGCQRLRYTLSANLISSSCMSMAYPRGKGADKVKLLVSGEASEVGVWVAKAVDKEGPVFPKLFPCVGSLSHDPMGCRLSCSSEITKELTLCVRWCMCQEAPWVRVKSELNLARSCESVRS